MISGKIKINVGDKLVGEVELGKGLSDEEAEKMIWRAILAAEPPIYTKGMTVTIQFGDYRPTFKVKKMLVLHGVRGTNVLVTIPVTLDTLKGLGFITKK
jgi:hypothetical protein